MATEEQRNPIVSSTLGNQSSDQGEISHSSEVASSAIKQNTGIREELQFQELFTGYRFHVQKTESSGELYKTKA